MRVTKLNEVEPRPRRIAVGEFDGVHLGHREVIEGSDTVLTFDPHPLPVVRPEAAPKLLTTLEVKAELIAGLGVEELVVIPFDERSRIRARRSSSTRCWWGAWGPRSVSVGENFRFGHRAAGDPRCCRRTGGSRPASCRWSRSTARSSPRATSGPGSGRRCRGREPVAGRAVPAARRGRGGRPARPDARLPDGQHRPR